MKIPFYKNTKDNLRCLQACLKMILEYWLPEERLSFVKLDKISGRLPKMWTWDSKSLLWLAKYNFSVVKISPFNYKKFAKEGTKYLKRLWLPEVFKRQNEMSKLKRERHLAQKLVASKYVRFINHEPKLSDINFFLNKGFTIIANVNPRALDDLDGYSSHSVVVLSANKKNVRFHDPGIPSEENRRVNRKKFSLALKELIMVKKNKNSLA